MLRLALLFFVVALLAAMFGFGLVAEMSFDIAKILFFVFLVLAVLAVVGAALPLAVPLLAAGAALRTASRLAPPVPQAQMPPGGEANSSCESRHPNACLRFQRRWRWRPTASFRSHSQTS